MYAECLAGSAKDKEGGGKRIKRIETDTLSCAETFGYGDDYEHDQGMRNKRYSGESECF